MKDFNELDEELMSAMPQLRPTTDTISEVFADIVFSYRIRGGFTQQQLADEAKVGVKTIHRIEGGSGGITDTTLEKVLKALDVDMDDVIAYLTEKKKKCEKQFAMS